MRVVIVTESFPPDVNGVAHCALQTARHLVDRGHDPLVVAPARRRRARARRPAPCPVVRVPSLPLPGYPQVRVALPSRRVAAAITEHRADIVHLASPFVLGVRGMAAAARLGSPPSPSTRPTSPATPVPTSAPARPPPGGASAPSTPPPTAPSPRPARPCTTSRRTACPGCGCGRAAWTPSASAPDCRDEALRRELAPERRADRRLRRPARPGEAGRTARRGLRGWPAYGSSSSATGPASQPARGAARRRLPRPPDRRRTRPDLRLPGRLRAHRPVRDVLPDRAGGHGQRRAGRRARRGRAARPGRPRPDRAAGAAATTPRRAGRGAAARRRPGAARRRTAPPGGPRSRAAPGRPSATS